MRAGLERLVHPSPSGEDRLRQRRLLSVLLAGPFVAAAAVAQSFGVMFGTVGALAALFAVFGVSWLAAFYMSTCGRVSETQWFGLGLAVLLGGALVAFGGGLGAPTAILLVALPVEAYWIARSRAALLAGVAGALVAAVGASLATGAAVVPVETQAWLWLSPLLYGVTLALRVLAESGEAADRSDATVRLSQDCFDAVVVKLAGNGEAASVSPLAQKLFGVDPALLLGSGLFERLHVADRVAFMCAGASTRDSGKASRCPVRIRMPVNLSEGAGLYRPFEAEFVRGEAGDDVVVLIRDGGEVAALRDDLARANEQVSATEVTKSRFLATVSHELRTPLNAIIGFSDMLLHREISGDLMPKQAEHVGLIREAGNHLLSVVNAILDVSKIEAGSYLLAIEPFDLKPAAELCCAMLDPQAREKGVNLSVDIPERLGEIVGDQRAVQQILINLVSNAIKFTPEGGSIGLSAVRRNDTVRIFVNDTGIGIAPDDLAGLGQPFRQVQNDYTRQFQGTGLGLSLVKGLVKLHGGTMSIESAPGLGTTVTIGLPATDSKGKGIEGETGEGNGIALRKTA